MGNVNAECRIFPQILKLAIPVVLVNKQFVFKNCVIRYDFLVPAVPEIIMYNGGVFVNCA